MRGTVYLYRWRMGQNWLYKFYHNPQPSLIKHGEFELVTYWPDCNQSAAFDWIRHRFGSKECIAPNEGVYRLTKADIAALLRLRKIPPGTTGGLWKEIPQD